VRLGSLERLAGKEEVYLFVAEGDQTGDGQELAGWEVVGPCEVLVHGAADADRPVSAGGALVGAGGDGVGGDEVLGVDLCRVEVVPVGSPVSKTMTGEGDSARTTPSSSTRTGRVERNALTRT
jgi:hypothetical protein